MSVWYEGGSVLSRLMEVVVQTGLKAVMVEGQLITKLCRMLLLFTVSSVWLFGGDFAGDGEEERERTEGWSYTLAK